MLKTYNSLIKQTNPNFWLDSNNNSSLSSFTTYQNLGVTGGGTANSKTITLSASGDLILFIGQKFRIGLNDVYTISNVSATTLTTVETLSSNYTSQTIYALKTSQISDSSGNLNNSTSGVISNQPIYVESSIGSKPSLGFNSSSSSLSVVSSSSVNNLFHTGGTLFSVFNPRGAGGNNLGRLLDKATTSLNGWLLIYNNTTQNLSFQVRFSGTTMSCDIAPSSLLLNQKSIVCITYNASSITNTPNIYVNTVSPVSASTTQPTGSVANDSSNDLYIGNRQDLARGFNGNISENILWNRILSQQEISLIMKYLGNKYGVIVS